MDELVCVEPFALDGRMYGRGDPITDPAVIETVLRDFSPHVHRRAVHDGAPSLASAAEPETREQDH